MNGLLPPSADLIAELNRMHSLLDQVFPAAASSIRSAGAGAFPTLNVGTTPTTIEVMALAPGLDPARLDISVDRGMLAIAGDRPSQLPPPEKRERMSVSASSAIAPRW